MARSYARDPEVQAAMIELKGTAVDRVLCGLWCLAGAHSQALLGSVQILVAGPGLGVQAVDGRVRQPGKAADRPRGFREGEAIPLAARAGASMFVSAAVVAQTLFCELALAKLVAPAVAIAKGQSPERAKVLEACKARGPTALAGLADELVRELGPRGGGALSVSDLEAVAPHVEQVQVARLSDSMVAAFAPWDEAEALDESWVTSLVAATDSNGVAAVGLAHWTVQGARVSALGLVAPCLAAPVRRGVERIKPGVPCPGPGALALAGSVDTHWPIAAHLEGKEQEELRALLSAGKLARAAGLVGILP
jgi:hypothetical protein